MYFLSEVCSKPQLGLIAGSHISIASCPASVALLDALYILPLTLIFCLVRRSNGLTTHMVAEANPAQHSKKPKRKKTQTLMLLRFFGRSMYRRCNP